jgi:hypothetical protein
MVNLNIFFEDRGENHNISFPSSGTFEDLVDKILELNIPLADDSFFLTKGSQIELEKKYNFEENQKIIVRRKDALENLITTFNNVCKTKDAIIKRKVHKVSKGCGYRYICQGINLYGVCGNESCTASSQEVIQMIKDNELNLVKIRGQMQCPMCGWKCDAKTVGFYKCYFNIYGTKYNEEKKAIENFGVAIEDFCNQEINTDNTVLVDGKRVQVNKTDEDSVSKFNEHNGEVDFIKLVFQVKKF